MSRTPNSAVSRRLTRDETEAQIGRSVDAFRRVLRRLRVVARKTELATGLSAAQLFVLSAVVESPGCSVNEIAQATMTDRSSAAAVVDRLVEQGYVTRTQSADDRRRAAVTVTARGRGAMRDSSPPPTAILIAGLRALSSAQLRGLSTALVALTEAMDIADEPAGMLFDDAPSLPHRADRGRRRTTPKGR